MCIRNIKYTKCQVFGSGTFILYSIQNNHTQKRVHALTIDMEKIHATTVLGVIHNGTVSLGADGQATMGHTVAKGNVKKVRALMGGKILVGFAGSTADAFTLLERFEDKLNAYGGNMKRAAIELAKDWRTDR